MVHVEYIIILFQTINELDHLLHFGVVQLFSRVGNVFQARTARFDIAVFQRFLHGAEIGETRIEYHLVVFTLQFFQTCINQFQLQRIPVVALCLYLEYALAVEQEGYTARGAQRAATPVEIHTHVRHRTGRVVGSRFHKHRNAVRALAFVHNLLKVVRLLAAGLLDGTFHVGLGHIGRFGILNGKPQPGVVLGVGPSRLHRQSNLPADAGEGFGHAGPTLKLSFFAEFKRASHNCGIFWLFAAKQFARH